jgi:hypothetical protein
MNTGTVFAFGFWLSALGLQFVAVPRCLYALLPFSLYQNRTLPVSETNLAVYKSLIVSCKSHNYKLAGVMHNEIM